MSIQLYSSPMKYKDPNTGNYTNIIGISGNPGRGIASVELNNDYTLTLTFTDGTSTTTSSIRGNGIESIEKTSTSGLIDTYTITDSDSNTYTFEVTNGDVPNLTIGTVTEGEEASATITGSRENPVLNLVLPLPSLTNYVKKTDYANGTNTGVIRVNNNYGLTNVDASDGGVGRTTYTAIMAPTTTEIRTGADRYKPIVPRNQHEASFYGLAKAAGDTSQAQSSNAVGTYTASAKAAIQTMLDVPSNAAMQQAIDNINTMKIHICTSGEYDAQTGVPTIQNPDAQTFYLVPGGDSGNLYIEWVYVNSVWERFGSANVEVPVNDVQVNGVSVLDAQGVANVPRGSNSQYGVIRTHINTFNYDTDGRLVIQAAGISHLKEGTNSWRPIMPNSASGAAFYGLAKAAGDTTQSASSNAVGSYTDEAKSAIRTMLGVGEWQIIKTVTLTEDAASVVITTDEASQNFKLKEMAFIANLEPSSSTTANTNAHIRIDPYYYALSISAAVRPTATNIDGYIKPITTAMSNQDATIAQIGSTDGLYWNGKAVGTVLRNYSDYFELYTTGTAKFGAGSVITLLGVRA